MWWWASAMGNHLCLLYFNKILQFINILQCIDTQPNNYYCYYVHNFVMPILIKDDARVCVCVHMW
jgi:hypothetical protein